MSVPIQKDVVTPSTDGEDGAMSWSRRLIQTLERTVTTT